MGQNGLWSITVEDGVIRDVSPVAPSGVAPGRGGRVDLRGACVLPGLVEAHMHFSWFGLSLAAPDLGVARSIGDVQELLRSAAPSEVLLANNFDEEKFAGEKRLPTRWDLDEVSRQIPIIVIRYCGHCLVANSAALAQSGIEESAKDIPGGWIGRGTDGKLNGQFKENAMQLTDRLRYSAALNLFKETALEGQDKALGFGLTSVSDMDASWEILEFLRNLEAQGKLRVRINLYMKDTCLDEPDRLLEETRKGNLVRVRGLKLFADGEMGVRSAALYEEYADEPGNFGLLIYPPAVLREKVARAHRLGIQVAIHAEGDKAIDLSIDAIASTGEGNPLRHRIEHFMVPRKDAGRRAAEAGIPLVVQPIFLNGDHLWAEKRIGRDRLAHSYPLKSLLECGARVAGSSDAPVESIETANPFPQLFSAVSHVSLRGEAFPDWVACERISLREALSIHTQGGAFASFEDKGEIRPGQMADFTIVPSDILGCATAEIKDIRPLATIVGGELVWSSEAFARARS
jgi:predicted amidohydrolase YtcJ